MSFEAKRLLKLATCSVLMLMSAVALAYGPEGSQVNMDPGVTEVGESIYSLHMIILIICTVIGVAVFGVMFYSIIDHRYRDEKQTLITSNLTLDEIEAKDPYVHGLLR